VLRTLFSLAGFAAVAAAPLPSRAGDGGDLFTQNCLMCHQAGGAGLPGQFPRLTGRIGAISSKPKGRAYLIDVLTYGMTGKITVDDQAIIGLMPPFAQLSNDDVAGVLSYVQSLGDPPAGTPAAFTAEEVRAGRANTVKTPTDVRAERQSLEDAKIVR
jgi:mono/diheme cytochrome c family protein